MNGAGHMPSRDGYLETALVELRRSTRSRSPPCAPGHMPSTSPSVLSRPKRGARSVSCVKTSPHLQRNCLVCARELAGKGL